MEPSVATSRKILSVWKLLLMMLQNSLIHFFGDIQCYKFNISGVWIESVVGIGFFWGKRGTLTCCCTSGAYSYKILTSLFIGSSSCTSVQIRVQNFHPLQGKLLSSVFNKGLSYKKPTRPGLCWCCHCCCSVKVMNMSLVISAGTIRGSVLHHCARGVKKWRYCSR